MLTVVIDDTDELYRRLEERFSPDELIELLNITTSEMLEAFYERIFQFDGLHTNVPIELLEALDG